MNEIQVLARLTCNNSGYSDTFTDTINVNQSTNGAAGGLVSVPTSYAAVPINGIATLGYLALQNCDATNYVEVGHVVSSTFYGMIRLQPGQIAVLPCGTLALYWQANTAAVPTQYLLLSA